MKEDVKASLYQRRTIGKEMIKDYLLDKKIWDKGFLTPKMRRTRAELRP